MASKSPAKGISYYNHFPKNFLKPYGGADDMLTSKTIKRRLYSANCEWLICSEVALRDMVHTIAANVEILDHVSELFNGTYISRHASEMGDFLRNLQHFNNKQDGRVSKENIKQLIVDFNTDTDR